LMIDFIPKTLESRTMEICSKGLGSQSFNFLWKAFPPIKLMPNFIHDSIVFSATVFWRLYLPLQRRFMFLK
jgi:hypothetical protein